MKTFPKWTKLFVNITFQHNEALHYYHNSHVLTKMAVTKPKQDENIEPLNDCNDTAMPQQFFKPSASYKNSEFSE